MKFLSLIYLFFISTITIAQSSVNAGGTSNSLNGLKFTYTLGQPFGAKVFVGETIKSEGVQQPIEVINLVTGLENLINVNINVYPNPTYDLLNIHVDKSDFQNVNLKLIDLNGKDLKFVPIKSKETILDLKLLPSAVYFIEIIENEKLVRAFKVIKN